MRYLHIQIDDVVRYVSSAGLAVTRCDPKERAQTTGVDEAAIVEMLSASEKLWGGLLPYYLWVSSSNMNSAPALKDAVTEVETGARRDSFLLVGYADGGVISISNEKLGFQAGARPADWWRP